MIQGALGSGLPLAGIGVVVTRPTDQARRIAKLIEVAGGKPILFPVIEIRNCCHPELLLKALEGLADFDIAIFVSPNAVKGVASRFTLPLPPNLRIAAIGTSTKRELERLGVDSVIAPSSGFDSEALLGLPEMKQISGRRIAIFRGNGGRDVLRDGLTSRGASVEYIGCYRRVKPSIEPEILFDAWRHGYLDAITVTSVEGLHNLVDIVGDAGTRELKQTPLFVLHSRIGQEARALGIGEVIVTGASDEAMLAAIIKRFEKHERNQI